MSVKKIMELNKCFNNSVFSAFKIRLLALRADWLKFNWSNIYNFLIIVIDILIIQLLTVTKTFYYYYLDDLLIIYRNDFNITWSYFRPASKKNIWGA